MFSAVLDTNVLVSAFAWPKGVPGKIFDAWVEGRFALITSEYILNEFAYVAKVKLKFENKVVSEAMEFFAREAVMVQPLNFSHELIYRNDWPIIGTALAGNVDFLVTGDKRVLKFASESHIPIVTPAEFWKKLA